MSSVLLTRLKSLTSQVTQLARGGEVAHLIARPETQAYSFRCPKSDYAGDRGGTESMFKELINLKGRHGLTECAGHVVAEPLDPRPGSSGNSSAKNDTLNPSGMCVEVLCSL